MKSLKGMLVGAGVIARFAPKTYEPNKKGAADTGNTASKEKEQNHLEQQLGIKPHLGQLAIFFKTVCVMHNFLLWSATISKLKSRNYCSAFWLV
ncbi:hypothetical protein [Methylobacter sp.]|uniref:hypothetical protein n=1 Tax=Methylobacter sp. TaxID=2051955 RepID=UPI002FDDF570